MIRIFLALFIFFMLNLQSFANVFDYPKKISEFENNLPKLESINCKFSQEKIFPNSNVILKSSGDFEFKENIGVTFYTTYPIKSTTSYTTKEYRQINNIILAISKKNYSKLEKEFKFFFINQGNTWTLGLVPQKNSPAYNYLNSIEISGSDYIKKMTIITKDGTRTNIKWEKHV